MRVLLDTDVILDLLLNRAGFVEHAAALWEAHEQGRLVAYISVITPVNVFYIARKLKGADTARQAVVELLAALPICPLDQRTLETALTLPFSDYEDAVQLASAIASHLDALITRKLEDYKNAALPVFNPPEFLARL